MKSKFIAIILSLSVIFSACQSSQPVSEVPDLSEIDVVFDGKDCLVKGQDQVQTTRVNFTFDNQSELSVNLVIAEISDQNTVDDVFDSFSPGSTDFPDGAAFNTRSLSIPGGTSFDECMAKFFSGEYAVLCEVKTTMEKYFGAGFAIP